MRSVQEPRLRFGLEGSQGVLSMAGLYVRQVFVDRGAAESTGRSSGIETAADAGGQTETRTTAEGGSVPSCDRVTRNFTQSHGNARLVEIFHLYL